MVWLDAAPWGGYTSYFSFACFSSSLARWMFVVGGRFSPSFHPPGFSNSHSQKSSFVIVLVWAELSAVSSLIIFEVPHWMWRVWSPLTTCAFYTPDYKYHIFNLKLNTGVCGSRMKSKERQGQPEVTHAPLSYLFVCVVWCEGQVSWCTVRQLGGKSLPWNWAGSICWASSMSFFFFFSFNVLLSLFQNMEKVLVPSVTLIVGCGVSSLTLLLLIIIYVSVWRYGFHSLLFLLGKVTVSWSAWILEVLLSHFGCLLPEEELLCNEWVL